MNRFEPFALERMMSKWENEVDVNLSESGVHPMSVRQLLALSDRDVDELLDIEINYPQANGTKELRRTIAALYDDAGPDNILATIGAAEANFLTLQTLLSPGDEMIVMRPNYMQIWGIAHNLGLKVREFNLVESRGWAPDLDELDALVTQDTKLIAICNPNNPTGRILTEDEMSRIIAIAERTGAWLLADEVYSGAERLSDEQTPSFYGRYDKVIAIGSMSKAYGLPGLRLGWVVGPEAVVDDIWARHEYTTIAIPMISDKLAQIALSPQVRPEILERTRNYIRKGYPVLEQWIADHGNIFSYTPPEAAAIAFIRYNIDINSTELIERLRTEKSLMIAPGDHFGIDRHVRISFGLPHDYLIDGLNRMDELLRELG